MDSFWVQINSQIVYILKKFLFGIIYFYMQLSKKRRNDVLYVNVLLSIYRSDFMLIKMSIKHYTRIIIICRQWMCNISYPSLNTLNRLIIVITCVAGQSASNTPTGITHLYIPEYRSPVLN